MAYNNGPKIITAGLILYFDAANSKSYVGGNTNWNDLSGTGTTAVLTNGPSFVNANGGSILFDGINDYANISSTISLGNQFTIMSSIKLSGSNVDTSIYGADANGADNWFGIMGDKLFLYATETADVNNFGVTGTTTLDTSNSIWYNVVATININTATVYLNGVQEATSTQAFTAGAWSSAGAIGRRGPVDQRYFKGHVGNIIMYNRVLSISEILQNFNATRGRFGI